MGAAYSMICCRISSGSRRKYSFVAAIIADVGLSRWLDFCAVLREMSIQGGLLRLNKTNMGPHSGAYLHICPCGLYVNQISLTILFPAHKTIDQPAQHVFALGIDRHNAPCMVPLAIDHLEPPDLSTSVHAKPTV